MASRTLFLDDPRVQSKFITIPSTDFKYHYWLAKPDGRATRTVLLLHGFPDLPIGWRNQVPYLLSLGLQVVVPDMLGYGKTSAPGSPEEYAFKKIADHMKHIVQDVVGPGEKVIVGGHDWGAQAAWRLAIWHPELILGIFSFGVHYMPPSLTSPSLDDVIKFFPSMAFQKTFMGTELEQSLTSAGPIRGFLNALHNDAAVLRPVLGQLGNGVIDPESWAQIPPTPHMPAETMNGYVESFVRTGFHGGFNWYRTVAFNVKDELPFAEKSSPHTIGVPALIIISKNDVAYLGDEALQEQYKLFDAGLKLRTVEAGHWAIVEIPDEANKMIGDFVKSLP